MAKAFATSWLHSEPEATALLPDAFRSVAARAQAVRRASRKPLNPELLAVVRRQNAALPASAARQAQLARLALPGTVVVVTGQQVGLFLGPLYTIYKVASAIAAARALEAETGVACVPLFWLQTEDHDFAEIDHCFLPRTGAEPLKVALAHAEPSRVPVAHRLLGEDVTVALAQVADALEGMAHAGEVVGLLTRYYRPGVAITTAFAETLAALLESEGVVFFDPRDADVARHAAPFHRRCIEDASALSRTLDARLDALFDAHFPPQVHVRRGAPLCFVSPDAIDGPRYRLDPTSHAEEWLLVGHPDGATVTTPQLRTWLDREPLRFTTSALSRPLLQDTLLPVAAYVGGPGEMAYFAQLGPLYVHFGLEMPLVLHRDRFALLDERTAQFLTSHHLPVPQLAQPRDALLQVLAAQGGHTPVNVRLHALMSALDFAGLTREMAALDPNLVKAVARTEDTVQDALGKLLEKQAKALAQRDHATVDRLDRARLWLMPGGVPQERVYAMPGLAARFGLQTLLQTVLAACRPFAAELQELTL